MNLEGLTEKRARRGTIYYENNIGEIVAKICRNCGKVNAINHYSIKKNCFAGRAPLCKSCISEENKFYREKTKSRKMAERSHTQKWTKVNLEWLLEKTHIRTKTVYYENIAGKIVAKVCTKCGEIKELEHYFTEAQGLGGLRSKCKICVSEERKEYDARNKERIFHTNRRWRERNKEYHAERGRIWKQSNPDKVAVSKERRRARELLLPHDLNTEQYDKTLEYFGNTCALTGRNIRVEMDHAIPLSVGHGGTVYGNCYPLIKSLNSSKCDRNIFEWFEANRQRFKLEQWRFDRLIEWLASANAMSVEEYRAYVYECHANPNEINDAKAN